MIESLLNKLWEVKIEEWTPTFVFHTQYFTGLYFAVVRGVQILSGRIHLHAQIYCIKIEVSSVTLLKLLVVKL